MFGEETLEMITLTTVPFIHFQVMNLKVREMNRISKPMKTQQIGWQKAFKIWNLEYEFCLYIMPFLSPFLYHLVIYTINGNLLYSTGSSIRCSGDINGEKIRKRGNICICITDSLCCTVDTNTILQSNYMPIRVILKIKIKKKKLEYSCFTMLCCFLLYSKVNQLHIFFL